MFAGLDTENYDRQYGDRELMGRMLSYFRAHRRTALWTVLLICGLGLLNTVPPFLVAQAVQRIGEANPDWNFIWLLASGGVVFGVLQWAMGWVRQRLTAKIVADVISALRNDAFNAAISHDLSFFDDLRSGRIISRITSDTQEFAQVSRLIIEIVSQVLTVIALLIYLLSVSVPLSLGIIGFTPIVIGLALGFRRLARFVTRKGFQVLGEVNSSIQEAVTGISIAKNFRQEARIYGEFSEINHQSYGVNLRRGFVLSNVFPTLNVVSGFGTAALIYWGGLSVIDLSITLAAWYVFVRSVDLFWFPLLNISAFWSQFQAGLAAAERIFALIDAEHSVKQTDQKTTERLRGEIVFDHVEFRYGRKEPVLNDFSLTIAPGESIALVGHTGAGKSSIAKLITRFYEFQAGKITVDGHDIRSLDLRSYRQQLGIVTQTPFLFDGTVADNIRYAAPHLSDAELEAVATQIGGGEWLETLPQGLQSQVGERGNKLSLGQRQLVALTRVLAAQPAIFILDEATASIDPFTETQIQQAMDLILSRSTAILIAHRLSTVRSADRIIVLNQGQIIEEGSHEQLMDQGGHYADLYDTYFRHQSLSYIESRGAARSV
ncbi:ABC transporter ATP-binding protein [Herpetosiphon giganteus]|uniref:ABC transporter ATP-binding protein n=1 Tax=Herpetosiphon giganteus TaxID=2029754 RepID=UPI001956B543|nr:ABC transporter ATP-binding protein [Herpetosiphon giganteus]MBM7841955.1 ATP-binding cassette subfamily B protein [Herpetosiphon giganteus]